MNRINIITLGVSNMSRSLKFYRDKLGFKTSIKEDNPDIIFFSNNGTKLALYPDPDGYYWEVAYSEDWKYDENDMLMVD